MDYKLREQYFIELDKEKKELINLETRLLDVKFSKTINCPLCDAKETHNEQLFIKDGYSFVRCDKCEMIFTNPQVDSSLLGELYGRSKANDLWVEIQESKKEQAWKKHYYEENITILNFFRNKQQTRLMDVGCSSGYFLEILNNYQTSINGEGVELSKKAFKYAKNKDLNVYNCFLSELDENLKYDIFTLFGVFEHLPNPSKIFEDIKLKANNGALIFAIVPNAYSLYHMFLQSKSVSFDGRNHLLYFSQKTFKKLFEEQGFEILKLDTVLTGIDNIKRQMQWIEPYKNNNTNKYLNNSIVDSCINEEYITKNNLGLRLRVIAKLKD
jgi:2-polyprenyl-3-methyl-5-hydroxy-6-metoxy-1,4-benzoquinol methylase